jgi:hypothetical protein
VGLDAEEPVFYEKYEIDIYDIICLDYHSNEAVFAAVDECVKTDPELEADETCNIAMGMLCCVFTDAMWMENVVQNNNSTGMCMGGDVVIQNEETDDCLIKVLSTNNEVNDIGPVIQSVGDECKLLTKAIGGKVDMRDEFKLPKATGGMTAVPGKLLWAYEYVIMQNLEIKDFCAGIPQILIVLHLSDMGSGSMVLMTTTRSAA